MLNSTFFDVELGGPEHDSGRQFLYRPYINYGLLKCRNENGTPITDLRQSIAPCDDPRTPGVGSLAEDLIKGHPPERQVRLLKRFLSNWKDALNDFCPRGMSYYLPRHLGGLGIPIVGDYHTEKYSSRFSRAQRQLAAYLDSDPTSAQDLVEMSQIGRSESLSLWQKVAPQVRRLEDRVGYTWIRKSGLVPRTELAAPLLASAYARLSDCDVAEVEEESNEDRYIVWRRLYEERFSLAERSTLSPMSDEDIVASQPWVKQFNAHVVVDDSPRVDLRLAPSQILSHRFHSPLISKKSFDEQSDDSLDDGEPMEYTYT